jgi:hypothetical protein
LFQCRFCGRKKTHTVREKFGRDLAATPHQFLDRRGYVKSVLIKFDREPVTHAEDISVVFAAITDSMFGEQFRIDLVPPRLGVGEHAVEIEDHCAKRWWHDVLHLLLT